MNWVILYLLKFFIKFISLNDMLINNWFLLCRFRWQKYMIGYDIKILLDYIIILIKILVGMSIDVRLF